MTVVFALALASQLVPPGPALPAGAVVRLGGERLYFSNGQGPDVSPDRRRAVASNYHEYHKREYRDSDALTGRPGSIRYFARMGMRYSPDGRTILALGPDDDKVRTYLFLDAATGRQLGRVDRHLTGSQLELLGSAEFAGPSRAVITDGDNRVRVFDIRSGTEVGAFSLRADETCDISSCSPDGRYLAFLGVDERGYCPLRVYEIATGRELFTVDWPKIPSQQAFAPNCRSIVTVDKTHARRSARPGGQELGAWPVAASKPRGDLAVCDSAVYLLTPDDAGGLAAHDVTAGRPARFPLAIPACFPGQPGASDRYLDRVEYSFGV